MRFTTSFFGTCFNQYLIPKSNRALAQTRAQFLGRQLLLQESVMLFV
jgi:hypothetical protein